MDRSRPAGELPQRADRVAPAVCAVADVHLHDDFRGGVAEENVPGDLAIHGLEVEAVGVVAAEHAQGRQLLCGIVENARKLHDRVARGHAGLVSGHDQKVVAQHLVHLDGALQVIPQQRGGGQVEAAAGQPAVVVHGADCVGTVAHPFQHRTVVAPRFGADVTDLRHGLQCRREVLLNLATDRVQLQGNRYLVHCFSCAITVLFRWDWRHGTGPYLPYPHARDLP